MNITVSSDNPQTVEVTIPKPVAVEIIGIPGQPGPPGPEGPPGPPGSAVVDGVWLFDTTSLVAEPPSGTMGFEGGTSPETIAGLHIHQTDADGIDRHGSLSCIEQAIIRLYLESDPLIAIWVFSLNGLVNYPGTDIYSGAVTLLTGLGESFPPDKSRFIVRIFPQLSSGGFTGYDYNTTSFSVTDLIGLGATKLFDYGDGNAGILVDINDQHFFNDGNNEGKLTLYSPLPLSAQPLSGRVLTVNTNGDAEWLDPVTGETGSVAIPIYDSAALIPPTGADGEMFGLNIQPPDNVIKNGLYLWASSSTTHIGPLPGGFTGVDFYGAEFQVTRLTPSGSTKLDNTGGGDASIYTALNAQHFFNDGSNEGRLTLINPVPLIAGPEEIGHVLTAGNQYAPVWSAPSSGGGSSAPPLRLGPVGRWVAATSGTVSHQPYGAGAGIIRLYRVYLDVPFDATGFQVETGVAGSNFRIGIYNTSPSDGRPTTLVVPQLQVDTSTSGTKFATHARVPPGWYWFGSVPSVSLTIRAQVNQASPNIPTASGTLSMLQNSWYISAASMPDPFPASGEGGSGDVALFYVRIAA